ncbi:diacylglycerol/lipid kinase family protein [Laceyella putida]|uniref:Diacylglycerol/lipid kinase family protein n=1 Tax=Laceyella putida TaxID=110101 RepID=A0ABW2RFN0_9BACL
MMLIVVNQGAGRGKGRFVWRQIKDRLDEQNQPYQVLYTKPHVRVVDELSRVLAGSHVDRVVAVGGDGTFSEVAEALASTGISLGLIPAGTGNDIARALQIPSEPEAALRRVFSNQPQTIDMARLKERTMLGFAGMGFDAAVADAVNRGKSKHWLGSLVYGVTAVRMLRQFKPSRVTLRVDGQEWVYEAVWMVAACNTSQFGGGMKICPHASPNDGTLDVCVVKELTVCEFLRIFPSVYRGKHVNHPAVAFHRGCEIGIRAEEPFLTHIDGDLAGGGLEQIQLLPRALSIL